MKRSSFFAKLACFLVLVSPSLGFGQANPNPLGSSFDSLDPLRMKFQVLNVRYSPDRKTRLNLHQESPGGPFNTEVRLEFRSAAQNSEFDFLKTAKGKYLAAKGSASLSVHGGVGTAAMDLNLVIECRRSFGYWQLDDWQEPSALTPAAAKILQGSRAEVRKQLGDSVVVGVAKESRVYYTLTFSTTDTSKYFSLNAYASGEFRVGKVSGSTENMLKAALRTISKNLTVTAKMGGYGFKDGAIPSTSEVFQITEENYKRIAQGLHKKLNDTINGATSEFALDVGARTVSLSSLAPGVPEMPSYNEAFLEAATERLVEAELELRQRKALIAGDDRKKDFSEIFGEEALKALESEIKVLEQHILAIIKAAEPALSPAADNATYELPDKLELKSVPRVEVIIYHFLPTLPPDAHGILIGWVSNPKVKTLRLRFEDGRPAFAIHQAIPDIPQRAGVYDKEGLISALNGSYTSYASSSNGIHYKNIADKLQKDGSFGQKDKETQGKYFMFLFAPPGDLNILDVLVEGHDSEMVFGICPASKHGE